MAQALSLAVAVALFLALYAVVRGRQAHRTGVHPPLQWGWLAAIVGFAVLALIAGFVFDGL
jgi:hypothetical protein